MSRLLKKVLILLFVTSASAHAEDCAAIENDLDRLACYDVLYRKEPNVVQMPSIDKTGKWKSIKELSEFEDSEDVFLSVESNDIINCGRYGGGERATLNIRCMENTTSLYISTDCHLTSGHGGYGNVDFRVDSKKSGRKNFHDSTDSSALGLWSGSSSIPFIKSIMNGDKILFRFTPFSQSPVVASFDISGLSEAIKPLRKSCGW